MRMRRGHKVSVGDELRRSRQNPTPSGQFGGVRRALTELHLHLRDAIYIKIR
jgi:hypothetical protein